MIRWKYGYRYLLAPEDYTSDSDDLEQHHNFHLHRHQTADSDENAPLLYHTRQSTGNHSRRTSQSDFPSEYEYSTAGTSPLIRPSTPLIPDEDDITSFPIPRELRPHPLHFRIKTVTRMMWREFIEFMNMPLWAMLVAVCVALFPLLQHYLFFEKNGFIHGSVIFAIQTCGDVSIPLILVILGANIANEDPVPVEDNQMQPIV